MMVTQRDCESMDDYEHRLELVRSYITEHAEDNSDVAYYTQFVLKRSLHHPAVNQVSPLLNHDILQAQLNDVSVQRMIRIPRDEEMGPLHPHFESQFFKKPMMIGHRLQVVNDQTSRATSKQTAVPDIIRVEIIRTLHENPCRDTLVFLKSCKFHDLGTTLPT